MSHSTMAAINFRIARYELTFDDDQKLHKRPFELARRTEVTVRVAGENGSVALLPGIASGFATAPTIEAAEIRLYGLA